MGQLRYPQERRDFWAEKKTRTDMNNTTTNLPQKLQSLASLLDAQPPKVQQAFQFLLATATHEAGKFELLNVAEVDGRWHYTFSGVGEAFSKAP